MHEDEVWRLEAPLGHQERLPEEEPSEQGEDCSRLTRRARKWEGRDQSAHTSRRRTKVRVSRRLLVGLRNLQVILRAPGSHLRAVSRRVAAMEGGWGPSEEPREARISKTLETEASAALPAPGRLWAGSSRCSGRGYRSWPPPRPHSWRGQTPQTCPAGKRQQSEPNTAPGDQEEESWVGTLGVGSVLAVCSGTALESALS